MINLLTRLKKTTLKAIPVLIALILLATAINFYVAKKEIENVRAYGDKTVQEIEKDQWSIIKSSIELSSQVSREHSQVVAQQLESQIVGKYTDLSDLRKQFERNHFETDFYQVLKGTIQKDEPNPLFPSPYRIVVAFQSGVISIFSNEGDPTWEYQDEQVLKWDKFYTLYPNQAAVASTVDAIKSREDDVLFIQRSTKNSQLIDGNNRVTLDDLEWLYYHEGLKAMKDFEMLAPAYIRDSGDIFDTDDRDFMQTTKNYKLFIIQSTNLGDILARQQVNIDKQTKQIENTDQFVSQYIYHKNIQTILWSFVLFIFSVVLIFIYNHENRRCCDTCPGAHQGDHQK